MRIGRKAYLLGSEQFATTVGPAAHAALKLLPEGMRAQKSLEMVKLGFDIFYRQPGAQVHFRVEDRGERLAYIAETCAMCAGKQSDEKMCQLFTGFLLEGLSNVYGKEYQAMEVECRALGAPACVWEVSKLPKE
jgi:predicted hydrocarbon binding protein